MVRFSEPRTAAVRPVINTVQERTDCVTKLKEIATREKLPSLLELRSTLCETQLLLSSSFLSLKPYSVVRLQPGPSDGSKPADDSAQQAANGTRHAGMITGGQSIKPLIARREAI
jgi:hypothetical protein